MGFYDEMQGVASSVLADFGQAGISYVKVIPASGPPDNPGQPGEQIILLADAVARGVEFKYVDGTQIVATDGQIVCAVNPAFEPRAQDFVIVKGKRHKVKKGGQIPPTGVPVAYIIFYEG